MMTPAKILYCALAVSAYLLVVLGEWKYQDQSKWVDPHDPINYDRGKQTDRRHDTSEKTFSDPLHDHLFCDEEIEKCRQTQDNLVACNESLANEKKSHEICVNLTLKCDALRDELFFKQYIRKLLRNFEGYATPEYEEQGRYHAEIVLTSKSYTYLLDYGEMDVGSLQEVHSILTNMMSDVRWVPYVTQPSFDWELVRGYLDMAWKFGCVVLCTAYTILLFYKTPIRSLKWFVFTFCILAFLASVPWTWVHLYKKKLAANHATIVKEGISERCLRSDDNGVLSMIYSAVFGRNKECKEYFEKMQIDPVWEVTPVEAVVATFTQLIVEPAGHVGDAIQALVSRSLDGLPLAYKFFVGFILVLMLVLGMFTASGYGVRTLFFSIGPHAGHNPGMNQALMDRLSSRETEVDRLRIELETMRRERNVTLDQLRLRELEMDNEKRELLHAQERLAIEAEQRIQRIEGASLNLRHITSQREWPDSSNSDRINQDSSIDDIPIDGHVLQKRIMYSRTTEDRQASCAVKEISPNNVQPIARECVTIANNVDQSIPRIPSVSLASNNVNDSSETSDLQPLAEGAEKSIINAASTAGNQMMNKIEGQSQSPVCMDVGMILDKSKDADACRWDGGGDAKLPRSDVSSLGDKLDALKLDNAPEEISIGAATSDPTERKSTDDIGPDSYSDYDFLAEAEFKRSIEN